MEERGTNGLENSLKYSINTLDVLKNDEHLMIAKCKILKIEEKTYWDTRFYEEDVLRNIDSLKMKPIIGIWKENLFDKTKSDFKEHARDEKERKQTRVFGCIPETNDAKIEEIDGHKWLTTLVVFWKHYNTDMINKIVENSLNGIQTDVSMEIMVNQDNCEELEDGTVRIKEFNVVGICLLGMDYNPAVEDAGFSDDSILKYSTVEDYQMILQKANEAILKYSMEGDAKVAEENKDEKVEEIQENSTVDDSKEEEKEESKDEKEEEIQENSTESEEETKEEEKVDKKEETEEYASEDKKEDEEVQENSTVSEEKYSTLEKEKQELEEKYSALIKEKEELEQKYSTTVQELNESTQKYSETMELYSALKSQMDEMTAKCTELETYKAGKIKEENDTYANSLFTKYAKYFEDDKDEKVRNEFKEVLYSKGKVEFDKEISSFVLPKIEAENIAMQSKYSTSKEQDIMNYSVFPLHNEKETEEKQNSVPQTSFDRLNEYVKNSKEK